MKKKLYHLLVNIGSLLVKCGQKGNNAVHKIAKLIHTPILPDLDLSLKRFYEARGDAMRYNYALNEKSLVFDLGGYEGQWSSEIYSRYRSKIYVFEVYRPFAQAMERRFLYNPDISIFGFGLSNANTFAKISLDESGSSMHKQAALMVDIELVSAAEFMKKHNIEFIDLMKLNIEGAEYDLLDHLIETGYHKIIRNLQIQFHSFVPDALERMTKIREQLSATHTVTYQFDFVWENWELI
jgi:FkbM family methyltransferase